MTGCNRASGNSKRSLYAAGDLDRFQKDSKEIVNGMAEQGVTFSLKAVAEGLGLCRQTLYNYCNRSQEWKKAIIRLEADYRYLVSEN